MANVQKTEEESAVAPSLRNKMMLKYTLIGGVGVLLVLGIFAAGYLLGNNKEDEKKENTTFQDLFNPGGVFTPPTTTTGKVNTVSDSTLVITPAGGEAKTISVGKEVPITRKGAEITLSDIKADETVIAFTQDVDGKSEASRLIVK